MSEPEADAAMKPIARLARDERISAPASAEFDAHARDYEVLVKPFMKRLLGGGGDSFIDVKVKRLLRRIESKPLTSTRRDGVRLLDYGTGTGLFLRRLVVGGFRGEVAGCDVSPAMIEEAIGEWPGDMQPARFDVMDGNWAPYEGGSFDVVVACCVLHHVAPADRPRTFADMARVLRPGGLFVVFEHNPYNPLTRWMVARSPLDRNAVLLSADETRQRMLEAAIELPQIDYFLYGPPRLPGSFVLDAALGRIPLGGQYEAIGQKLRED